MNEPVCLIDRDVMRMLNERKKSHSFIIILFLFLLQFLLQELEQH